MRGYNINPLDEMLMMRASACVFIAGRSMFVRRKGARTIGQDEGSSVVYGMPKVAFNIGAVEKQTSLEKIPKLIYSLLDEE